MIHPEKSLLKYDNPVLIRKTTGRPSLKEPLKGSLDHKELANYDADHSSPQSTSSGSSKKSEREILDAILPPREWMEGNQLWVQHVSRAPCTKADVIKLEEELVKTLQQRQAKEPGICPIRRELYSQCFDELIRQVTTNCAERGLLLLRVRNETQMTLDTYQTLYESSVAFGMRKAFQAMQEKANTEKKICDLENKKQDLKNQLSEQKAICDDIEKREKEKAQIVEKTLDKEIQFMKEFNQQFEAQLEEKITPKK